MRTTGFFLGIMAILALPIILAGSPSAQDFSSADCADCHADTGGDLPEVMEAHLAGSVHAGFECLDCHTDIEELPHAEELEEANCAMCHSGVAEAYTQHGLGKVGKDPGIPTCAECHGAHDILPVEDKESRVNPLNLPTTCGSCHEDEEFTSEQEIRFKHPVKVYSVSIHGRAALGGIYSAATCNDCHSTGGDAHKILPPGNIESTINHFNIT
ncbi:MAG: hypothetical protein GF355_15840, partial [Candidatus Eisenbacteria bacterium]|nr:hypothetical protein [Candidatus Eisenbacteria bacterium]